MSGFAETENIELLRNEANNLHYTTSGDDTAKDCCALSAQSCVPTLALYLLILVSVFSFVRLLMDNRMEWHYLTHPPDCFVLKPPYLTPLDVCILGYKADAKLKRKASGVGISCT